MSSVSYNGEVVNSVINRIGQISSTISNISSGLKSATNQIISAKGFQKYVGGVSSDSFSGAVDKCSDTIGKFSKEIRQKQVSVLAYSEDKDEINAFLDGLSRSEFDSLDLSEINSYIGFDRKAENVLKGVGSTVATFGLSLFEGLGELLETGADLVVLGVSGAATIFTKAADLITGGHNTKDLWENTKAFVSDKKVENIFNSIYNDTEVGQYLKENAYAFEGARSVGSGVGYTAGLIGLNVLTGGLSSGLGVGAAGSITPAGLATSAGVLGFSRGTEDAWADGATIENGLAYGVASGAWEGLQWYAGAKINQYGGLGDKIAQGIFKGAAKGVGTRIAMDTVDSALEGFVQPALSMIYKDYGKGSFIDNYKTAFDEAGGWQNVGTHAIMGGIASTVGEYVGARRLLKAANADETIDDRAKEIFESDGVEKKQLADSIEGGNAGKTTDIIDEKESIKIAKEARRKELLDLQNKANSDTILTEAEQKRLYKLDKEFQVDSVTPASLYEKAQSKVSEITKQIELEGSSESLEKQLAHYKKQVEIYGSTPERVKQLEDIVVADGYKDLKEYGGQTYQMAQEHGIDFDSSKVVKPPEVTAELQAYADSKAQSIHQTAKTVEPTITKDLESLESTSACLMGEDHKLKRTNSLSRKIIKDAGEKGSLTFKTIDTATEKIGDSIRYTMLIENDKYVDTVKSTISELQSKGYSIKPGKFKNFWGEGNVYQGINVNLVKMVDGSEVTFELQFHTLESFYTKSKLTHTLYEVERSQFTSNTNRALSHGIALDYQSVVSIPDGATTISY